MSKINSRNANKIISRLKSALKFKADKELAKFFGISASTLSTWKSRNTLDYPLLFAKCEKYDIDIHWLIRGSNYLKNSIDEIEDPKIEYKPNKKIRNTSADTEETIKFVSSSSHIKYINNFNNVKYIENLPSIRILDIVYPDLYRSFEVIEDSMSTMFIPGDRILGKYVDDYTRITNLHPYIIITEESIQIRKIVLKPDNNDFLELHSHNPVYKPYSPTLIAIKDIKELWKWAPPLFRMSLYNDNKEETIQLLQDKVNELSKKK
jgi:transcriptional regulator with XRE-family HTH domain